MNAIGFTPWSRAEMARRVALDIDEGWCVNLGIGIPTMVAEHIPSDRELILHSENGILGMGPAPAAHEVDPWMINAGKQHVTLVKGASLCHHADSFALIRGGHIDLCVLGAYQVAANGDLANWSTGDDAELAPAVGGAMDLAVGAKRIWVVMEHTTRDGTPRLVRDCTYPLTAHRCVTRVYTNFAVLDALDQEWLVREMAPGMTLDRLQAMTGSTVKLPVHPIG